MEFSANLSATLHGHFRIEGPCGESLTPTSAKAQGVLALLLTNKDHQRSRNWLQDKLWSDRSREQGAASLRQALTQIRKAFGPYAELLVTNRQTVALPKTIRFCDVMDESAEFLEGMDVRDQEFEDWLRLQRQARQQPAPKAFAQPRTTRIHAPENKTVVTEVDVTGTEMERLFSEVFVSGVASSLNEQLCIDAVPSESNPPAGNTIRVRARAAFNNGTTVIHASCIDDNTNRQLWSGYRTLPARGAPPVDHDDVLQMRNEAIDAISEAFCVDARRANGGDNAEVLASLAVQKLFSMNPVEQREADVLLAQAFEINPRGAFLAWRILLRVVQILERNSPCAQTATEELREMSRQALLLEPMNSLVLSIIAYAKLTITSEISLGYEMARRSSALNPANPFAWMALATAEVYLGHIDRAHTFTSRARHIGTLSPYRYWWDTGTCLTATASGDLQTAQKLAQSAHALSPSFRPPLRYLIALHVRSGNLDAAVTALKRLKELEPGFVAEQLIEDGDYPSATLRNAKLISGAQLRDLV